MEVMILSCYNPAKKLSDMWTNGEIFRAKGRTYFRERLGGLPVVARAGEYLDVIRVQAHSNLCAGIVSTDNGKVRGND